MCLYCTHSYKHANILTYLPVDRHTYIHSRGQNALHAVASNASMLWRQSILQSFSDSLSIHMNIYKFELRNRNPDIYIHTYIYISHTYEYTNICIRT